ncbi:MAG: DUF6067 family protein [bacterium]|nr:DUF6067 family protein [bacterium]
MNSIKNILPAWLVITVFICTLSTGTARAQDSGADDGVQRARHLFDNWDRWPAIAVPQTDNPPQIDGKVGDAEWRKAGMFTGLISYQGHAMQVMPSQIYLTYTKDALYIAYKFTRQKDAVFKRGSTGPVLSPRIVNKEDGVEMSLSMDTASAALLNIYGNSSSGYSSTAVIKGSYRSCSESEYQYEYESSLNGRGFEGEIRIPVEELTKFLTDNKLSLTPLAPGNVWRFNPMRSDIFPKEIADWSLMWGTFYDPDRAGKLMLQDGARAVRVETLGSLSEENIGVSGTVDNGGKAAMNCELEYEIYQSTLDVVKNKIDLIGAWDIINRYKKEGPNLSGLAQQEQMGEVGWLGKIGKAYKLVKQDRVTFKVEAGQSKAFMAAYAARKGQFVIAYRIKEDGKAVLASQVMPYEKKAGLDLTVSKRFLTVGGIVVSADIQGLQGVKAGDRLDFAVKEAGKDKVLKSWSRIVEKVDDPLTESVVMSDMPEGNYRLEAKATSSDGTVLAKESVDFNKPSNPSWWKNRIGYTEQVPAPWTPVKASLKKTEVWGRSIEWGKGQFFPEKITSRGQELLAAPISMDLSAGGKKLNWKRVSFKLVKSTPREAVYEGKYRSGNTSLTLKSTIAYDGLIRFDATISGKDKADSLTFRMPMSKEAAAYYAGKCFGTGITTHDVNHKAGKVEEYKQAVPAEWLPFTSLFWLGNGDVGVQWICEEDKYWSNKSRDKVMRLVPEADKVTLEVGFIDQPTSLEKPRTITFALMPAPVKDIGPYLDYNLNTAFGVRAAGPERINVKRYEEYLEWAKKSGLTHLLFGGFGAPFHADVWVRGHNRNNFKETVDIAHKHGIKLFYYGCWGYDVNGDEAADFKDDMVKQPLYMCFPDTYWYNPEGPWVDFYMAGLQSSMNEYKYDGLYIDSMANSPLIFDPATDTGYVDEDGKQHGKWPHFALRQWAERMYVFMHVTGRKDGIVVHHESGIPDLAIVSFADIRTGGEDAPDKDNLRESFPLDYYISKSNERQYGIPFHTLFYNYWNRSLKENQALSVTLLLGQTINRSAGTNIYRQPYGYEQLGYEPERSDYELMSTPHIAILNLMKSFGIRQAEWLPYWRNGEYIKLEPGHLKSGMYLHEGRKALIVVSNLNKEPVNGAAVTLNLDKMKFTGKSIKVTDALLKTPVSIENGRIKLDMESERYRLLLIEASP